MEKRFWILLGVIVVILIGIFVVTAPKNNSKDGTNTNSSLKNNGNLDSVQTYDHVRGSKANKVVLIEYGDFQCPVCGQFFPIESEAFRRYGSVVTFVYRDFPLTQIHPNAFAAARAAEAAANQGKFWQMHDQLYNNQSAWSDNTLTAASTFESYAQQLGLNMDQFKSDYSSENVNNVINTFMSDGNSQKVNGTPTLILNGQTLSNPSPNDPTPFYQQIEAAIKSAGLKVPKY
jgi:protein-disulfide isomerase